jgi:hypothetical protein
MSFAERRTNFTRRVILRQSGRGLLAAIGAASGLGLGIGPTAAQISGAPATVERWMSEWIAARKAPVGTLHLSRFRDPIYFLTKPIGWTPNPGDSQRFEPVTVPVGFVTDFASIPQVFWSVLRPDGEYTYPAIIHDYLYWTQTRSRFEADAIFKVAMSDFELDGPVNSTIYTAVRLGGFASWRSNATAKAQGEKRVLRVFPNDPRIRWDDWKKRTAVFV